jgi:CheY-like chemotaxis protein
MYSNIWLWEKYTVNELREKSDTNTDRRYHILVVDDSIDTNLFFKAALEEEGFSVDAFTDPFEVIQTFKPNSYDLLLIDIRMPQINGFKLCKLLKAIDKSIKVCFITGFEPYYQSLNDQFKLDINCFIRKPIEKSDLIRHVINQLITSE